MLAGKCLMHGDADGVEIVAAEVGELKDTGGRSGG